MSPYVIIGVSLFFLYFLYRETRDLLQRDSRLAKKAQALCEQGLFARALPLAEKAYRLFEKTLDPDDETRIGYVDFLAWIHWRLENLAEARDLNKISLKLAERLWGKDHTPAAERLTVLGKLQVALHEDEEGIPNLRRAAAIFRERLGDDHENTKEVMGILKQMGVDG